MEKKLEAGEVYQTYGDGSVSGPFLLKEEGLRSLGVGSDYWQYRVNLYKLDGSWSHVAHYKTLSNEKVHI